ncbi:hypothetical protein BASA60_011198 [Batrachochytrium salamandrivorans]|nr:hypothetical protein BASA60_011198 [Batrachochytrium salamandrivorans]
MSVSSYPIGGSESEFKPTETTKSSSTWYAGSDSNKGGEVSPEDSSKPKKTKKGLFKWFRSKKEVGEPKEDPSKPKKTKKRLFEWLGSKKEAGEPKEDSPKPKEPTKKLFKWFGPKRKVKTSTETTKSSSTWYAGSDDDKPKEPQDPPTQKQSGEVITTPKKGFNRGSSSSTGASTGSDMYIDTGSHQTKDNNKSTLGQTKVGASKEDLLKPEESTKSSSKSSNVSDNDKPKEPQDPPTQKQSNEDITTPKKESKHGSSGPTGASTGSDMYIDTGSHQTKNNNKSTLGQTKVAALKEDSLEPEESAKSSSKSSAIKERVEVPPEDSYKPTETTKKPFQWSKLKGNNGSSKGGSLEPKESTQGSSKLSNISDDDGPKPLQDPPTQKQSGGAINAPKVGSNRGSSGPTGAAVGPNGAISTDEDIDPDLPGELIDPQEKKRPIPTPATSSKIPEVTSVHDFLALDNLRMPLRHRQEIAFKLFSLLNNPKYKGGNKYILTRIPEPEKERIEQENMVEYFGLSYRVKKKNQKLLTCEREILSFPGSGPSLALKYSEAKKSQTKTIEKRALTDEEEGEYLIYRCLTTRGKLLSAQTQSRQAWSKLTDEQTRFYDYIKPMIKNLILQFEEQTTDSE